MIICFFLLGWNADKKQRLNPRVRFFTVDIVIILFVFALFCGLRNNVGVDYPQYLEDYLHPNSPDRSYTEWLYKKIVDVMSLSGIHYSFYFATIAFLQLLFSLLAFKSERFLFPFLLFVLMTNGTFFMWMNGMRQCFAVSLFLFSTTFINKREPLYYLITIVVACLLHKSAVLVLPLYLSIFSKDIFKSKTLQLVLLAAAVLLSATPFWNDYIKQIETIANFFNIGGDTMSVEDRLMLYDDIQYTKGFRFYSTIAIGIVCIIYGDKVKKTYSINLLYNLFFCGLLSATLFYNSNLLQRPLMYFIYLQFVTIAYTLVYLRNNITKSVNRVCFWFLVASLALYLLVSIHANTYTQYYFIWQEPKEISMLSF